MIYDFVVIGGGMAGVSVGAELAAHASVRVLEMESQPGYHSTGRSAALFAEAYGNKVIRSLTRASRAFFFAPPAAFTAQTLVNPRAVLFTAREGQAAQLEHLLDSSSQEIALERIAPAAAAELLPILRREELIGAAVDHNAADIEVHELLQGYLRELRRQGGILTSAAAVTRLSRHATNWQVETTSGTFEGKVVVNAAGAWAGAIAHLAGALPVGLTPLRRSACLIDGPANVSVAQWPMLIDAAEQFYLKPDAGRLLLSPADETPAPPGDAQPDDLDIAIAVDRLEEATTLKVSKIHHQWAGLRSFVSDRSPVTGYDPLQPGFFWHAALGGYGIQTAPALSRVAALLALKRPIEEDLLSHGVDTAELAPTRLAGPRA
jgi:D-arginine dehydrogenase